jgi:hypothetical protein
MGDNMNRKVVKLAIPATVLGMLLAGAFLSHSAAKAQGRDFGGDRGHRLVWSGDVDDTTIVILHRGDVDTHDVHGQSSINVNDQVFGRLPPGPCRVFLAHWDGRGDVQIVREPSPENDFSAAVRIHDPQSGRGHYDFVLVWQPIDNGGPIRAN